MYKANFKIGGGGGGGGGGGQGHMEGWKLYTICTLQLPNITAGTSHGLIFSNRYCSYHCLNVYHNIIIVYLNQKIENS